MPVEAPPAPTPAATPPAPPPPATPPKPELPPIAASDPFIARVMADMGLIVKDGKLESAPEAPPPATGPKDDTPSFTTMGEVARWKKERQDLAQAQNANPPETPAAPAATPPAAPGATPTPLGQPTTTPAGTTKPKIEVERGKPIEEIVEGIVKKLTTPPAVPPTDGQPPPAQPKPSEPQDPDAAYIDGLDEPSREEIELAQFAARSMPEKYGTMPKRMVDYLKKVDTYLEQKRKEDPDWDPDTDREYSEFIAENRPTYQGSDRRKLERSQIVSEVRQEVTQEFKPQIEQAAKVVRSQELKPELDKATDSYRQRVTQSLAIDEKSPFQAIITKVAEGGFSDNAWKEAEKADRLAASIARKHVENAVALGREYLELASNVRPQAQYQPQLPPTHPQNQEAMRQAQMFAYIDQQEAMFNQGGGNLRINEGRSFLPRKDFYKLPDSEKSKHWTLTHTMVMDIFNDGAAAMAAAELNAELQRRAEEGFVRPQPGVAPKSETPLAPQPAAPPAPLESPRATTTAAPGTELPKPPPSQPSIMGKGDLDKLWSPGRKTWGG